MDRRGGDVCWQRFLHRPLLLAGSTGELNRDAFYRPICSFVLQFIKHVTKHLSCCVAAQESSQDHRGRAGAPPRGGHLQPLNLPLELGGLGLVRAHRSGARARACVVHTAVGPALGARERGVGGGGVSAHHHPHQACRPLQSLLALQCGVAHAPSQSRRRRRRHRVQIVHAARRAPPTRQQVCADRPRRPQAAPSAGRLPATPTHRQLCRGRNGGRFQPGNLPDEQTIYCGVAAKARFSLHFPPDACSEAAAHCGNPGTGVPRARSYRGSQARCWRGGGRRTAEVARPCSSQRRGACHENNSRASVTKKTTHRVDKCGWARTWEHNLRSPQLHFLSLANLHFSITGRFHRECPAFRAPCRLYTSPPRSILTLPSAAVKLIFPRCAPS